MTPLTVDDVIASLNHHRGEGSTSGAKQLFVSVNDIKADGQNLVVHLGAPNVDFPYFMSDYHLPVMPSANGKVDITSTDGCGGYIVESYQPGVQATLKRNPNYWKTDRAFFDGLELLSILDPAARLAALITGAVDAIDQVSTSTALVQGSHVERLSVFDADAMPLQLGSERTSGVHMRACG